MADNIYVNEGTAVDRKTVATDEINSVHFPIYKVSFGIDGEQIPVSSINMLPVSAEVVSLPAINYETDVVEILNEVSDKLSILIKYMAIMNEFEIEE